MFDSWRVNVVNILVSSTRKKEKQQQLVALNQLVGMTENGVYPQMNV
jgi:hypothetical protein